MLSRSRHIQQNVTFCTLP